MPAAEDAGRRSTLPPTEIRDRSGEDHANSTAGLWRDRPGQPMRSRRTNQADSDETEFRRRALQPGMLADELG